MKKSKYQITLLVALSIACFIIVSCKKDKKEDTNNSNLIVGNWKTTGYIHDGADVFGTGYPPCIIDDLISFGNTGVVSNDEGPTKCVASDPQTMSGTYTLNSNQTEITLTINGSTVTDSILTLNTTTLKLKQLSNDDLWTLTKQP